MKKILRVGASLVLAVSLLSSHASAEDSGFTLDFGDKSGNLADQRLGALNSALDELNSTVRDTGAGQRSNRGNSLNQAFVALTGEAVNPLFGVTALGMYNYFRAPEHLRESLPIYDQPIIWIPLACIILLMLFNSTACEAMPFLKVPLNAIGDIVNKAGAVAVLPLVIKMFADAVAQPAAEHFASAANTLFPVAYAGDGMISTAWMSLGWLAGAVIGVVIYAAVWLTFNVIDVLIMICPFPGVDALLKSFRLSIVGLLAGANHLSPNTAVVLAAILTLVSLFLAGWSFRLSVFGLIYSTDILLFRKRDVADGEVSGFSGVDLKQSHGIPMRTWGILGRNADGELTFSYRPWLVLTRRAVTVGKAGDFSCGRGLLNPFLVADSDTDTPWLRLPPRYRGQEDAMAARFGLRRVVDCGVSGALRTWLAQHFGGGCKKEVNKAAA